MKHLPVRILAFLMTAILFFSPQAAYASGYDDELADLTETAGWPEAPEIESSCAILIEAKTGKILYAKNADEKCYPASITKIMTGLLVLERCSLDETLTFSYRATHDLEEGSTHIARTEGEELSVKDCLYALLLASANEVAQGLAEHVSGSIEEFAVQMTERAKELGCTKTNFTNPSGLNDENHYTTCHDMAIIMRAAIQNSDFLTIDSTLTYTIPSTNKNPEELPIAMKHELVKNGANHYEGAIAGKTGYTTLAGNTLVTYAVRDNTDLICVVMKSSATHYDDTIKLLDYGFNNFTTYQLSQTDSLSLADASGELSGIEGEKSIADDEWLVMPNNIAFSSLEIQAEPIEAGETASEGTSVPAANLTYLYQGTEIASAVVSSTVPYSSPEAGGSDVSAAEGNDGETGGVLAALRRIPAKLVNQIRTHKLISLIVLVVVLLLLIRFFRRRRRRRRRHSYYGYKRRPRRGKYKMKR